MMTSEIESKISRVIDKLEKAQINLNYLPTTNETQEGNYRMQKRIAGVITQANVNVSSFDMQNESNQAPITESSNEISSSFSEQTSDILDQSFPKPSLKRRQSIILDLNKIINIGEYKIELGKLINILDKKLPDNKEINPNNETSKTYTQCTTEENESKKSFSSPEKKLEKETKSNEKNSGKELPQEINKNNCDEIANDKKFEDNLSKKYHKIYHLLKAYINENKLVNELNRKSLKENNDIIGNLNLNINETMNKNYRRKSLFDMTSYIIPSESSIKSFTKNSQLPNLISNFFDQKKLGKRKKRNTYVSSQLRNKLKKLNQQMNAKSTTKIIPKSEKPEFKIKPTRSSLTSDSNIKFDNMSNKKNISEISNFSNNPDNSSIIDNDNSVLDGNDNKRGSFLFNDGLSAVKKRRQSDFFDNFQQQEEITGFHKMISTIIEEEDNINTGNINGNTNFEKKENQKDICDNDDKEDRNVINYDNGNNADNKEVNSGQNEEEKNGEESYDSEEEDDEDDDTIENDEGCYNGNISTSLCFDELINF